MARNAAAMPQLVRMNWRRLRPSRLALMSANSRMRRSSRFCVSLCGGGRYSPFDTIWVGIGVAAQVVSAPATRRCSRSLSQEPIVIPPCLFSQPRSISDFGRSGHRGDAMTIRSNESTRRDCAEYHKVTMVLVRMPGAMRARPSQDAEVWSCFLAGVSKSGLVHALQVVLEAFRDRVSTVV